MQQELQSRKSFLEKKSERNGNILIISVLKGMFACLGAALLLYAGFPLSHCWWTPPGIVSGSIKELIVLRVLGAVPQCKRKGELCAREETHSLPSTSLCSCQQFPSQLEFPFLVAASPELIPPDSGPQDITLPFVELWLLQRAQQNLRHPVSLVAWWVFLPNNLPPSAVTS